MQEENNIINTNPIQTPMTAKKSSKDYLLPALLFLGLFFGFFVLITMQRLTNGYVHKNDTTASQPTSPTTTQTLDKKQSTDTITNSNNLSNTLSQDDQKQPTDVTTDVLNEIDNTKTIDVNTSLNDSNLNDLNP